MNKLGLFIPFIALYGVIAHADDVANITTASDSITPTATVPTLPAPAKPVEKEDLNCDYHVAPDKQDISEKLVSDWTEKAAIQAFTFSPETMQTQLDLLKACFTDTGWTGFHDALEKSGNLKAIQSQHLTVSSQVQGAPNITNVKDMRWKVTVPMEVVYQNNDNKITQTLNVDVLVGRKLSGDLGIMQIIATPKQLNEKASDEIALEKAPEPTTSRQKPVETDNNAEAPQDRSQ